MLENIKDHSIIVARVAEVITRAAVKAGAALNIDLVVAAALMHDIGKTSCLDNNDNHAHKGEEICLELGLDELAGIVNDHVWLQVSGASLLSESEVVYYADKRVTHDKVVPLADRRAYIVSRYGNNDAKRIAAIEKNCLNWQRVETKIAAQAAINTTELGQLIDPDPATFFRQYAGATCCAALEMSA